MAVVPPGGVWSYTQTLPNGTTRQFTDVSEAALVKQVKDFRITNRLEVGDVESDVRRKRAAALPESRSLRERVTGWAANRSYAKLEFVDPEIADKRASICVDCPFNVVHYADDCKECYAHVEQSLYAMRAGRETPQDHWLGACQMAGHENKTAVQLDEKNLLHRNSYTKELQDKHPACWLLHLDSEPRREVDS